MFYNFTLQYELRIIMANENIKTIQTDIFSTRSRINDNFSKNIFSSHYHYS